MGGSAGRMMRRKAYFPRAREQSTSFRFPRNIRSIDRWRWPPLPPLSLSFSLSRSLALFLVSWTRSHLYIAAPPALPRLIHYSAWLTANDFRYIRFSRGCTIACRLSLSRDAGGALNGPARMFDSFHACIMENEITRKNEQCGSLELFTRGTRFISP